MLDFHFKKKFINMSLQYESSFVLRATQYHDYAANCT